jgi:hypothetical protein
VSDDGEIRARLQWLGLELRHEQHERVRNAKARRQAALERSQAARVELEAALAAPESPSAGYWQQALTEVAALRLYEEGGDVDAERTFETVLQLVDEYLPDASPEDAAAIFALPIDEIAFDAQIAYLRLL